MAQHINNICNLSNIDGEKIKFITTDNFGVTQSLKNTGDIVLFRDDDRHDIYVGGEHIAGGYGFDDNSALDRLTDVAITYYDYLHHLNYIDENFTTINEIVNERKNAVQTEDNTSDDDEGFVNIKSISFELTENTKNNIVSNTDNGLILKAGSVSKVHTISLNIDGNCDITYLGIYLATNPTSVSPRIIDQSEYKNTYKIGDSNLTLSKTGLKTDSTNDYTDNIVIAIKNETMSDNDMPIEFLSKPIYWQLPYLFGTTEITNASFRNYDGSFVYRNDCVVDKMIETEITIYFPPKIDSVEHYFNGYSYGYFACPEQWGEPRFTHKKSGLSHPWEKQENPILYVVNGNSINYNVYKTKIEYYGKTTITWIISNK